MRDWGNIAVVTRIGGLPHPFFFDSWSRLLFEGMREDDRVMAPAVRMPAHRAANAIVRSFLGEEWLGDCATLCFVDDDHVFASDTLERLRRSEDGREYDVLGALYTARGAGRWPIILRRSDKSTPEQPKYGALWGWKPGDVVSVEALGLGFTLVRRELLERMAFPYFAYRDDPDGTEYTEDVVWCWGVEAAGGRMGVHTGVTIGHLDNVILRPAMTHDEAKTLDIEKCLVGGSNGHNKRADGGGLAGVRVGAGDGEQDERSPGSAG